MGEVAQYACSMLNKQFDRVAESVSAAVGRAFAFVLAVWLIIAWAVSGPVFKFNNTWQLIINTTTTVITFLLIVLLQYSQNKAFLAINWKLDVITQAVCGTDDHAVRSEERYDEQSLRQVKREDEEARAQPDP